MHSAVESKIGPAIESPSRERILKTAKALFALKGYEQATTSAIARTAATSETQLVKYFGTKQGILEAIFTVAWSQMLAEARKQTAGISSPKEKLSTVLRVVMMTLESDPDMKLLLLLEGRRIRKDGPLLVLTEAFMSFVHLLDEILSEMQSLGMIRRELDIQAVRSALMGMLEGMLRDSFLAKRTEYPAHYSPNEVGRIFSIVLNSLADSEQK